MTAPAADPCASIDCGAHGTLNSGAPCCACTDDYTGPLCTVAPSTGSGQCEDIQKWTATIQYFGAEVFVTTSYGSAIYKSAAWGPSIGSQPMDLAANSWEFVGPCNSGVCEIPTWSDTGAYPGGTTVEYEGERYQAKWWTSGSAPDAASEWEYVGPCAGSLDTDPSDVEITADTKFAVTIDLQITNITVALLDADATSVVTTLSEQYMGGAATLLQNAPKDGGVGFTVEITLDSQADANTVLAWVDRDAGNGKLAIWFKAAGNADGAVVEVLPAALRQINPEIVPMDSTDAPMDSTDAPMDATDAPDGENPTGSGAAELSVSLLSLAVAGSMLIL